MKSFKRWKGCRTNGYMNLERWELWLIQSHCKRGLRMKPVAWFFFFFKYRFWWVVWTKILPFMWDAVNLIPLGFPTELYAKISVGSESRVHLRCLGIQRHFLFLQNTLQVIVDNNTECRFSVIYVDRVVVSFSVACQGEVGKRSKFCLPPTFPID